jgi:glycosyltransferase involved in cell wall biosynthesis
VTAPLVLHTEASTGFGGQELRIVTEAGWLLGHGWRAVIACQPASALEREARAAGVVAVPLRMRHALDPLAFLALRRLVAASGAALVHTHSSVDSWLATLAAKSRGRPVVRSRHVAIAVRRRRAWVYHLADRIITSGTAVRDVLVAAGVPAGRIVSVPPGVDLGRFHPGVSGRAVRDELRLAGPAVGIVANLRGSKGHRVFLEAAREVARAVPGARFVIVGDGVGRGAVEQAVAGCGLGEAVIMTGFRRDIPEVMAALDVLVLPSIRSEAVSQVILQALAVGTPVVATAIGGSPEVVRDGVTGLLVPPADPAALARAIVTMLRAPDAARRMAREGQREVQAGFGQDAAMARTVAVYEDVLRRRPARAPA